MLHEGWLLTAPAMQLSSRSSLKFLLIVTRHAAEVSPIQPDVGDRITYRIDGKGPLKVGYVLKLLRYGELSVGTERQVMLDKLVS